MTVTKKISVDLLHRQNIQSVDAVQNDSNSRKIEVELHSGGQPWEIPSGMSVSVAFRKNDGTSGWYDTLPDGSAACSYSDNVVLAVLAPQMLTACGRVEVAVVIQDPSTLDRVATFPLWVEVARDPSAGKGISNDYYNYKTMAEINDAIDELWAAVGSGGSGGSCGCSITVAQKGSEDDPVSLSDYGIGSGDVVRFPEGDYYVEPFDLVGLDHVTFLLGDARIHCVSSYFLFAKGCDFLRVEGGTIVGGAETTHGIQIQRCKRAVFQQVCFSGIGTQSLADTKGLFVLGDCTGFLVDRCVFEDIAAGALTSDGYIHAYGILVNRDSSNAYSLRGDIRGCKFDGIAGIDGEVKADGDAIFIQRPPYLDDSGKVAGIDQVIDIDGCVFTNCKKRGVKSAAWGTTVRDCVFDGEFYYAAVDLQYGHGTVDGCRILNSSNYTGSVTSGVVANDGGFTVRDCYINCLYVNEDGTNGRHPAVRMDKRQPGSIFDKTVPWDPILVERCHFDEISYGVHASTSVSGVDTYRLTALEVLDCRWGTFYHDYGVDIESSVFNQIDVVRFSGFRFDAGTSKTEVQMVNAEFIAPILVDLTPELSYEVNSDYWTTDEDIVGASISSPLLVSVNSPKGSPSDPNDYELMVSTNGIDWTGVPGSRQFAGDIPLGSETHMIKYRGYYLFCAGADNGSPSANYDVLLAWTKNMVDFKVLRADFGIVEALQSALEEENRNRWAPCMFVDNGGNLWLTISVQTIKSEDPKYPWQSGRMFRQYVVPVSIDFDAVTASLSGDLEEISFKDTSYINIIDGTIYWSQREQKYIFCYKDNHECVVCIATSDNPEGPYTVVKEDLFDTPMTESGFICELNGQYMYTCVCHSNIASPLCSYVGFGGNLGEIGNIREIKYNGQMQNINGNDNMYLRMRMTFPIEADQTLRKYVSDKGTVIVSGLPERSTYQAKVGTLLPHRNSFTALPNVCYYLENMTSASLNLTNTAGCKHIIIRGDSVCKTTVNDYEVLNEQTYWRREYFWDGNMWRVSGYTRPYRSIPFENDLFGDTYIATQGLHMIMISGLPTFKQACSKGVNVIIGSTGSIGNESYVYSFRVRTRGSFLVVYQGVLIGEIVFSSGTTDNIIFKPFADITAGTVAEICCPAMCWEL